MRRANYARHAWHAWQRASLMLLLVIGASGVCADEAGWSALKRPGAIVLFRHADAPGVGDPPGMRLNDCASQRNLGARGRAQARRLGQSLRQQGVQVGAVLYSPWCRTRETAQLILAGQSSPLPREAPTFGSFFGSQGDATGQTDAAREILRDWQGPGALVVVTHQVNISSLTGRGVSSAEGIVVRVLPGDGLLQVLGRIDPPE